MNKLLLLFPALLAAITLRAADLVIAENKSSDYQIVIPEPGRDAVADQWLLLTARLMQATLAKNGFTLPIATESAKAADKPALYLGASTFAKAHGIDVAPLTDWTYFMKSVGRDVIIAGRDVADPIANSRGDSVPLARLGTAKGVCDFLREFAGVRFLFLTTGPSPAGKKSAAAKGGELLDYDTRSIAVLPVEKIALPENFARQKTPLMLANYDKAEDTFFKIANNFFPRLGSLKGGEVGWDKTLPSEKYAKTHPEFFALLHDGKRASELKVGFDHYMRYCPTNAGVQDLMFAAVEKEIAAGHQLIHLAPMDGFRLCECNCDDCVKLFGSKVTAFTDVRARGASGKLWQAYFRITERARTKYPAVRFEVLNYQDTPVTARIIPRFPENVIVHIQFASQRDFDRLAGVEFPAGISGFEETFTGFGQAGPYIAERTPEHMAEVVRAIVRNKVKWSNRDGSMGYVRGLQAPAYYVYGRMMDDPDADWHAIEEEFCAAAFGEMAAPMVEFYDLLHTQMALYSDFYGVFMPAWDRKYSRSKYHDSKWHVMGIYTPEFCADAHALLARAEAGTQDPDVRARLHLIRIDFDYARQLSRIFYLQNAWTMNPSAGNLDPLLDAIDEWHALLEKYAGGRGRASMKPLSDWPQMTPFAGHFYTHAALEHEGYQQQWNKTCLNWDTAAIRAGILTDPHRLRVTTVETEPALDAQAWDTAPAAFLRVHDGMPFANLSTELKILRDRDNLYVRIDSLNLSKHPEDFYPRERDNDIFAQDYVELAIAPPGASGTVFRFAVNPTENARYDAAFKSGERKRAEDKSWNPDWQYRFAVSGEKGPYSLPTRVWSAWFRIPFAAFGGKAPAAGESWGFNAGRHRAGQSLIWADAPSATVTTKLGAVEF